MQAGSSEEKYADTRSDSRQPRKSILKKLPQIFPDVPVPSAEDVNRTITVDDVEGIDLGLDDNLDDEADFLQGAKALAEPTPKSKGKQRSSMIAREDFEEIKAMAKTDKKETGPLRKAQQQNAPTPIAKKNGQSKWIFETKTPKNRDTTARRKQYGRRTGGLIEEAHDSGLVLELEEQAAQGIRRTQRMRFAPLEMWRNERILYTRRNSGVGTFLPTANPSKPISSPTPFDDPFARKRFPRTQPEQSLVASGSAGVEKVKKIKEPIDRSEKASTAAARPRSEKRKAGKEEKAEKANKHKAKKVKTSDSVSEPEPEQPEESIEEVLAASRSETSSKRVFVEPTCEVLDSNTNELVRAVVAKPRDAVFLQPLYVGSKVPAKLAPLGGKMLEEADFSNGILVLPPNSVKNFELATQAEVFYVAKANQLSLDVQIHKSRFTFSQGDSFTVPPGNMYHIKNTSSTSSVELYFFLVKN